MSDETPLAITDTPRDHVRERFTAAAINRTGVATGAVYEALQREHAQVLASIGDWITKTQVSTAALQALSEGSTAGSPNGRNGGLFYRDRYLTPVNPYDQMRLAYAAIEQDDIVSGVAEVTESLAFSSVSMFAPDEDHQDALNQWAADIDLDTMLRQMWRELFTVSQTYVAMQWGDREYIPRREGDAGRAARTKVKLHCPTEMSLLDPLKVVPVNTKIFGPDQLAWIATRAESKRFADILGEKHEEQLDVVERLVIGKYTPSDAERKELQAIGVDTMNLWLLNPVNTFRHCLTKAKYQRFSPIRMRSVFELLDLKQQLRQMERAHLIAGTNFIVVITQGSDALPADPAEIAALKAQARVVHRLPVMIGDHRLEVKIITPSLDNTLKPERFNALDSRITARLYQLMMLGNYAAGAQGDDSAKLVKVIARGMESRRHMMRRSLERYVFRPMADASETLKSNQTPRLLFHPRAIALDFDQAWSAFLLQLRQDREISRETILSQFDLDQSFEAQMREREEKKYDKIFKSRVAFGAPDSNENPQGPPQPGDPGARDNGGGNRNGGGRAPGSGQGQPPRNPQRKSDRGRKNKVAAGLTITLTDADGEVVATAPLDALLQQGDDDAPSGEAT